MGARATFVWCKHSNFEKEKKLKKKEKIIHVLICVKNLGKRNERKDMIRKKKVAKNKELIKESEVKEYILLYLLYLTSMFRIKKDLTCLF